MDTQNLQEEHTKALDRAEEALRQGRAPGELVSLERFVVSIGTRGRVVIRLFNQKLYPALLAELRKRDANGEPVDEPGGDTRSRLISYIPK